MWFLRHIIGLVIVLLVIVLSAMAMPVTSTTSNQAEFFPQQQDAEFRACITAGDMACVDRVMGELRALRTMTMPRINAFAASGVNTSQFGDLFNLDNDAYAIYDILLQNQSGDGHVNQDFMAAFNQYAQNNCGDLTNECITQYGDILADASLAADIQFMADAGMFIVDLTPAGSVVAVYNCATDASVANCFDIAFELAGPFGDLIQIAIRQGPDLIATAMRNGDRFDTQTPGANNGGNGSANGNNGGAGNGGVCSFHADTLVLTDGGLFPISDVTTRMSVWSRNPANGEMAWQPVQAQYSNPYDETVFVTMRDVETGAEQTIVSNRIHPYFVQTAREVAHSSEGHVYEGPLENGHWVDAADLQAGDRLLNDDGTWAEVVGVEIEAEPLTAFNLTVAEFHTYFVAANENASPVWVHNDCWDALPANATSTNRTAGTGDAQREIYTTQDGRSIYQGADGRWYQQYGDNIVSAPGSAYDAHADALAQRLGGQSQVRFGQDPAGREFDFISDEYVGQAKPGGFRSGSSFRTQARETFQAASDTGRQPYFHFDGPPHPDTISLIRRYERETGVTAVINTTPLSDF
jgi:hypothetical protein